MERQAAEAGSSLHDLTLRLGDGEGPTGVLRVTAPVTVEVDLRRA